MNEVVLDLIDNSHMCDITFVVGGETTRKSFEAHRLVLSGSSLVFNRLCLLAPINGTIELPNVDPDDFQALLWHIYGEKTAIESIQHGWNLLPTAKMFGISTLQEQCRSHILKLMDFHNAICIYEEAAYQEDGYIILESFKYITANTRDIFLANGLAGSHRTTIEAIAKQNCINVDSEYHLFTAALDWAKLECELRKLPSTPSNLREILNPLLPYVRFLRMRAYEFMMGPASSGILTKEEIMHILLALFAMGSPKLPAWLNVSREPREPKSGFQELSWNNRCVCLDLEKESCKNATTTFKNKGRAIFIVGIGFRLTTKHLPVAGWFSARISIRTSEGSETATYNIREILTIGEQTAKFDNPVYIKSGEIFQVAINVDDLFPRVHCCVLKSCSEIGPIHVFQATSTNDRGIPAPKTTCFSTIRYLSIT